MIEFWITLGALWILLFVFSFIVIMRAIREDRAEREREQEIQRLDAALGQHSATRARGWPDRYHPGRE